MKAEYLLKATALATALSSSGNLISRSPYTTACKHGVGGLLAPLLLLPAILSSSFESNIIRFYHPLSLPIKVLC